MQPRITVPGISAVPGLLHVITLARAPCARTNDDTARSLARSPANVVVGVWARKHKGFSKEEGALCLNLSSVHNAQPHAHACTPRTQRK